ncbi:hypothetical protein HMPREF9999_00268 [Alloprevotella sp. oral taxon 473 str. F0040]|nr:hypothetical protein HMPREF9999_00268 [Alloprevotella sp. oral taxon 473 str. F0040]
MWTCQKASDDVAQHERLLKFAHDDSDHTCHEQDECEVRDDGWELVHVFLVVSRCEKWGVVLVLPQKDGEHMSFGRTNAPIMIAGISL